MDTTNGLIGTLVALPIFRTEWVLFLLIGLSVASIAVMIERVLFYRRHRVDIDSLREELAARLDAGDVAGAAELLGRYDSLETNVVLFGLRDAHRGPEAVEKLLNAAERRERSRFEKRLNFLATVASNAPFIGLFGTVLGIIRAFNDLSANMAEASNSVMSGIAEALVATAVGLLVAIPAVVAFNVFRGKVRELTDNLQLLSGTLLSRLTTEPPCLVGGRKNEVSL